MGFREQSQGLENSWVQTADSPSPPPSGPRGTCTEAGILPIAPHPAPRHTTAAGRILFLHWPLSLALQQSSCSKLIEFSAWEGPGVKGGKSWLRGPLPPQHPEEGTINKGQTDKPCCPLTSQNWGALLHTAEPPAALNPLPDSNWESESPGLRQTLLAVNDGGWGTQGNGSAVLLEFLGPKHARGAPNWSQRPHRL